MRRLWLWLLLPAILAWTFAWAANAPERIGTLWALRQTKGVSLPIGACTKDGSDIFAISGNLLVWTGPARLHLPHLNMRLVSRKGDVLKVVDDRGVTGTITISNNRMVHTYSDGVTLIFDRCS